MAEVDNTNHKTWSCSDSVFGLRRHLRPTGKSTQPSPSGEAEAILARAQETPEDLPCYLNPSRKMVEQRFTWLSSLRKPKDTKIVESKLTDNVSEDMESGKVAGCDDEIELFRLGRLSNS